MRSSSGPPPFALEARDLARLRELQTELRTLPLEVDASLAPFVRDMGEVLGLPRSCGYGLRQRLAGGDDGQELSFAHTAGFDHEHFCAAFSPFVERQTVNWASYNIGAPEPEHRNQVVSYSASELEDLAATAPSAVVAQVYPVIGLRGHGQVRVVVCDGPSLLGWFGGFQPSVVEPRQQALLAALVPDLRRRLVVQRALEDALRLPLLGVVLDAVGSAALIVDRATGRIREANAAARARMHDEGRVLRAEVAMAAAAGAHPAWEVTTLVLRGGAAAALLIAKVTSRERLTAHVSRASKRWNLTARQREVLAELAEGLPNRTVAAVLGVSERTVEVHVTAVLEKAGVESRAALIAAVYSLA